MTKEEFLEEIDRERKWLDEVGYTPYNIDIAFSSLHKSAKKLEQEPCEDCISRQQLKEKLQQHHDFFVNAYGGFKNLPPNDKSRVDEITHCIAEVVNAPSVQPKTKYCKDCKWWKDSDGTYKRGHGAESICPINTKVVHDGEGYCYLFSKNE